LPSDPPLRGIPTLVLAAGLGTRLRPLTDFVPKPAVPVLGRPLAGYALARVYAGGAEDVFVNAHHLAERLQATLDSWAQRRLLRLRLHWSVERPDILGTGGALKRLEGQLTQPGRPILVINGDALVDVDLTALVAAHTRSGAVATLYCVAHPDAARYGAVRIDGSGRVIDLAGLGRMPGADDAAVEGTASTVFTGVHVLDPSVLAELPAAGTPACIVRQGYAPLIRRGAPVRAVIGPADTLFFDVGTPGRYLDAERALFAAPQFLPVGAGVEPEEAMFQEAAYARDAAGREYGDRGAVVGLDRAELVGPVFFGPGNSVGAGARIGPFVSVGARNMIGAGARIEDAALWSQVEVRAGERLSGVIGARLGGEPRIIDARPA
jgi:NDP-sugar pyrophosphorylase family protein